MILESVLNLFSHAIKLIFGWVNLPDLPDAVLGPIGFLGGFMNMGMSFVVLFLDIEFVKIMIPLVIAVANFDKMYKLVMFVLRKIPFLGIK